MISLRNLATTPADGTDALQHSLEELSSRREARQREETARLRKGVFGLLDETADTWSGTQELRYRQEVEHVWRLRYPQLWAASAAPEPESSMLSTATLVASNTTAHSPQHPSPRPFSMMATTRRPYPALWAVPTGTGGLPASGTKASTTTAAATATMTTPRAGRVWPEGDVGLLSRGSEGRPCLVRVLREALRLSPTADADGAPSQPGETRQRVLARWPHGRVVSAKVSAVLRSIGIEERKRVQWNEHVQHQRSGSSCVGGDGGGGGGGEQADGERDGAGAHSIPEPVPPANTSGPAHPRDDGIRSSAAVVASDSAIGRELYWPAYITRARAVFTGAACLHDDYRGIGRLQEYDRFEPVLALALASPLRMVVDVVYAVDEISEALGLSIDPAISCGGDAVELLSHDDGRPSSAVASPNGHTERQEQGGRGVSSDGRRQVHTPTTETSVLLKESYPLLLPSALPPVLSDLNYSYTVAAPSNGYSHGGGDGNSSGDLRRGAAPPQALLSDDSPASIALAASVLRRNPLSTSPLSLDTILAGAANHTHLVVLLRATPDVVRAARARALEDLERRWSSLRQALINRLVAYEEEAPTSAAVTPATPPPSPPPTLVVQLPDPETYGSPFIDRIQDKPDVRLPGKRSPAVSLTTGEDWRRQTRLPQLQGGPLPRRPLTFQRSNPYGDGQGRLQRSRSPDVALSPSVRKDAETTYRAAAQTGPTSSTAPNDWGAFTASPHPPRATLLPSHVSLTCAAEMGDGKPDESGTAGPAVRDATLLHSVPSPPGAYGTASSLEHMHSGPLFPFAVSQRSPKEESSAVSASVRAVTVWQRDMEEALQRQRQPVVAPRVDLSARTVEAPSPVSSVHTSTWGGSGEDAAGKAGEGHSPSAVSCLPNTSSILPSSRDAPLARVAANPATIPSMEAEAAGGRGRDASQESRTPSVPGTPAPRDLQYRPQRVADQQHGGPLPDEAAYRPPPRVPVTATSQASGDVLWAVAANDGSGLPAEQPGHRAPFLDLKGVFPSGSVVLSPRHGCGLHTESPPPLPPNIDLRCLHGVKSLMDFVLFGGGAGHRPGPDHVLPHRGPPSRRSSMEATAVGPLSDDPRPLSPPSPPLAAALPPVAAEKELSTSANREVEIPEPALVQTRYVHDLSHLGTSAATTADGDYSLSPSLPRHPVMWGADDVDDHGGLGDGGSTLDDDADSSCLPLVAPDASLEPPLIPSPANPTLLTRPLPPRQRPDEARRPPYLQPAQTPEESNVEVSVPLLVVDARGPTAMPPSLHTSRCTSPAPTSPVPLPVNGAASTDLRRMGTPFKAEHRPHHDPQCPSDHHSPHPVQPSPPSSSSSRKAPHHRKVLVRRVVRRCRSEVFVNERGGLVERRPIVLASSDFTTQGLQEPCSVPSHTKRTTVPKQEGTKQRSE